MVHVSIIGGSTKPFQISGSSIGVNISERKSGKSHDKMHTKGPFSFFSPPECATGSAVHRVNTTRAGLARAKMTRDSFDPG